MSEKQPEYLDLVFILTRQELVIVGTVRRENEKVW